MTEFIYTERHVKNILNNYFEIEESSELTDLYIMKIDFDIATKKLSKKRQQFIDDLKRKSIQQIANENKHLSIKSIYGKRTRTVQKLTEILNGGE